MKLSVLDYGLIDEGRTAQEALAETVQLAQRAEELAYHRFWVAEHHNVHAFAISSPELVMAHLASQTQRIRIGSGGIMALHYPAFKLAEEVATLTSLYPDRIDIGWGNSLGTAKVSRALKSQHQAGDFEQVLEEVAAYLTADQEPFANPRGAGLPPAFTLGMGGQSAQVAGRQGLGYVLGLFPYLFDDPFEVIRASFDRYRQAFRPYGFLAQPQAILGVFVVVGQTAEEAEALARAVGIWLLGKEDFNHFKTFPSVATAQAYQLTAEEEDLLIKQRQRLVVGTPDQVKARLQDLAQTGQADELLIIPLVPGFDNRLRSLELLAGLIS